MCVCELGLRLNVPGYRGRERELKVREEGDTFFYSCTKGLYLWLSRSLTVSGCITRANATSRWTLLARSSVRKARARVYGLANETKRAKNEKEWGEWRDGRNEEKKETRENRSLLRSLFKEYKMEEEKEEVRRKGVERASSPLFPFISPVAPTRSAKESRLCFSTNNATSCEIVSPIPFFLFFSIISTLFFISAFLDSKCVGGERYEIISRKLIPLHFSPHYTSHDIKGREKQPRAPYNVLKFSAIIFFSIPFSYFFFIFVYETIHSEKNNFSASDSIYLRKNPFLHWRNFNRKNFYFFYHSDLQAIYNPRELSSPLPFKDIIFTLFFFRSSR